MAFAIKRWCGLLLMLLALSVCLFSVHYVVKTSAKKQRAITYQAVLESYLQALQPGITRRQVEDYLIANNIHFSQMCCVKPSDGVYDDITKIGQEDAPWFCSANNVYVAFLFTGAKRVGSAADPSDKLTAIELYPHLEGCL